MHKVFPHPKDLPQGSQPFAREVISRIQDIERTLESSGSEQVASNKGQAAALQNLSKQFADLSGRASYAQFGTQTHSRSSVGNDVFTFGPTLTFTLTEPRVVRITGSMVANIQTRTSNTSNAYGIVIGGLIVNGSVLGTGQSTQPEIAVGGENANGGAISWRGSQALTPSALITLGAGTHTVAYRVIECSVAIFNFGGSPTASVTLKNPSVIVDVLQPL